MIDYLTGLAFNAWVIYSLTAVAAIITIPIVGITKAIQKKEF